MSSSHSELAEALHLKYMYDELVNYPPRLSVPSQHKTLTTLTAKWAKDKLSVFNKANPKYKRVCEIVERYMEIQRSIKR